MDTSTSARPSASRAGNSSAVAVEDNPPARVTRHLPAPVVKQVQARPSAPLSPKDIAAAHIACLKNSPVCRTHLPLAGYLLARALCGRKTSDALIESLKRAQDSLHAARIALPYRRGNIDTDVQSSHQRSLVLTQVNYVMSANVVNAILRTYVPGQKHPEQICLSVDELVLSNAMPQDLWDSVARLDQAGVLHGLPTMVFAGISRVLGAANCDGMHALVVEEQLKKLRPGETLWKDMVHGSSFVDSRDGHSWSVVRTSAVHASQHLIVDAWSGCWSWPDDAEGGHAVLAEDSFFAGQAEDTAYVMSASEFASRKRACRSFSRRLAHWMSQSAVFKGIAQRAFEELAENRIGGVNLLKSALRDTWDINTSRRHYAQAPPLLNARFRKLAAEKMRGDRDAVRRHCREIARKIMGADFTKENAQAALSSIALAATYVIEYGPPPASIPRICTLL